MPYERKYKRTSMGRRFFRRRSAASTIQKGWRARMRRRRGGLVARTALANRKSIKRINRKIETKYASNHVCLSTNNYTGQLLNTDVDCLGMPNQLAGVDQNEPNTPGTINPVWSSNIVCMRPICVENGIGEQQRVGEDIHMTWLNLKGSVSAYPATLNGTSNNATNWAGRAAKQKVRVTVVLDTAPVGFKAAAPPAYQPKYQPGYVYNLGGAIATYPALPATLTKPNKEYLRGLAKQPFGSTAADGSLDPWSQSYFENNFVQSRHGNKTARFKVLKTLVLTVDQPISSQAGTARKNFSITIKAPYRFHFPDNTSTLPDNQEILVFFTSDVKVGAPGVATDMTPTICTPKVTCQAKLAFKDP